MSYYQLGDKAIKVSMKLFALNRKSLLDRLRKVPNLPKSAIVILEGGKTETRHCTDHEHLFRQVFIQFLFWFYYLENLKLIAVRYLRSLTFIGVLVSLNRNSMVPSKSTLGTRSCLRHDFPSPMESGWESLSKS